MKLQVEFEYMEGFLPTKRHKILRYREVKEVMNITVKEATTTEAPIAFLVHECLKDTPTIYRLFNDKLWMPVLYSDRVSRAEGLYPLEKFIESLKYHSSFVHNKDKETAKKEKKRICFKTFDN